MSTSNYCLDLGLLAMVKSDPVSLTYYIFSFNQVQVLQDLRFDRLKCKVAVFKDMILDEWIHD